MSFDRRELDRWVEFWNTYDLDKIEDLFVPDDRLTYFSSEREGVLRGIEAVRKHHEGFGFVPGGRRKPTKLWLEDVHAAEGPGVAVVTAIWCFSSETRSGVQRGPLTLVFVPSGPEWRIVHAHFANYAPRSSGPSS
jgi:ketosteroid isomerase-like protein